MNKEKVIGLSNRLNSIVDEANRHPNGNPGHITWSKAVYSIECLSKEVNSKPVMPKVFDEHAEKLFSDLNNILMEGPVDLKSWNDMVIIVTRLKPYFMDAR